MKADLRELACIEISRRYQHTAMRRELDALHASEISSSFPSEKKASIWSGICRFFLRLFRSRHHQRTLAKQIVLINQELQSLEKPVSEAFTDEKKTLAGFWDRYGLHHSGSTAEELFLVLNFWVDALYRVDTAYKQSIAERFAQDVHATDEPKAAIKTFIAEISGELNSYAFQRSEDVGQQIDPVLTDLKMDSYTTALDIKVRGEDITLESFEQLCVAISDVAGVSFKVYAEIESDRRLPVVLQNTSEDPIALSAGETVKQSTSRDQDGNKLPNEALGFSAWNPWIPDLSPLSPRLPAQATAVQDATKVTGMAPESDPHQKSEILSSSTDSECTLFDETIKSVSPVESSKPVAIGFQPRPDTPSLQKLGVRYYTPIRRSPILSSLDIRPITDETKPEVPTERTQDIQVAELDQPSQPIDSLLDKIQAAAYEAPFKLDDFRAIPETIPLIDIRPSAIMLPDRFTPAVNGPPNCSPQLLTDTDAVANIQAALYLTAGKSRPAFRMVSAKPAVVIAWLQESRQQLVSVIAAETTAEKPIDPAEDAVALPSDCLPAPASEWDIPPVDDRVAITPTYPESDNPIATPIELPAASVEAPPPIVDALAPDEAHVNFLSQENPILSAAEVTGFQVLENTYDTLDSQEPVQTHPQSTLKKKAGNIIVHTLHPDHGYRTQEVELGTDISRTQYERFATDGEDAYGVITLHGRRERIRLLKKDAWLRIRAEYAEIEKVVKKTLKELD